jgi:hypothetical protein
MALDVKRGWDILEVLVMEKEGWHDIACWRINMKESLG